MLNTKNSHPFFPFYSADHEDKFQNMMKNIFDLKMDRTTTTLMGMMALFSVSHAELQVCGNYFNPRGIIRPEVGSEV